MTKQEIERYASIYDRLAERLESCVGKAKLNELELQTTDKEISRNVAQAGGCAVKLAVEGDIPKLAPFRGFYKLCPDTHDENGARWLWACLAVAMMKSIAPEEFRPGDGAIPEFKKDEAGNILGRNGKPLEYEDIPNPKCPEYPGFRVVSEPARVSDDWGEREWVDHLRENAINHSAACRVMAQLLRDHIASMASRASKKPKPRKQDKREPRSKTTSAQDDALTAVAIHHTQKDAAKSLRISPGALSRRLKRARQCMANLAKTQSVSVRAQSLPTGHRGEPLLPDDS